MSWCDDIATTCGLSPLGFRGACGAAMLRSAVSGQGHVKSPNEGAPGFAALRQIDGRRRHGHHGSRASRHRHDFHTRPYGTWVLAPPLSGCNAEC